MQYMHRGERWRDPPVPRKSHLLRGMLAEAPELTGDKYVGAWKDDDNSMKNSGSVYLFRISPHNAAWQQLAKLTASDAGQDDHFGRSVAIDGGVVAVGAYYDDDSGSASGSVYLFKYDGERAWPQVAKLTAGDAAAYDQFGRSLAISGGVVAVGAHYDDDAGSNSGAVYVFRTDNGGVTWPQVAKLKPHDAGGGDQFGGNAGQFGECLFEKAGVAECCRHQ